MRLTQTVSAGRLQKTAVLAAAPAVAVLEGRRRGAGGAVGLGGAAAAPAGRMALWGGRQSVSQAEVAANVSLGFRVAVLGLVFSDLIEIIC